MCREAAQYRFASVCVNPYWTSVAASDLAAAGVKVCTVVAFPLGATLTDVKAEETAAAIRAGANEIDMVMNIGALRGGDYEIVLTDIAAVVGQAHAAGALVKVILETALLDDVQKGIACVLASKAGADFVKTSTGFGPGGATQHDVALMRAVVGPDMGVKASGGIRTRQDFDTMIRAGANRIGASASVKIVQESGAGAAASEY